MHTLHEKNLGRSCDMVIGKNLQKIRKMKAHQTVEWVRRNPVEASEIIWFLDGFYRDIKKYEKVM